MLKFDGFESRRPRHSKTSDEQIVAFSDCMPFACVVPRLYLPGDSIRCTWLSCIFHHESELSLTSDVGPHFADFKIEVIVDDWNRQVRV
jgi:hypothetical protein